MSGDQFLQELRQSYKAAKLTKQQYKTLIGQVVSGEVDAAQKGFQKLKRKNQQGVDSNGTKRA
jgi:hypothetical protein